MQVNLVFGFLGSGKTTLVRHILERRPGREPLAVIVNEFGDVGIDGAILEGRDVDLVELTSGCLCCTLKGSLLNAIEELRATRGVERVVIEATGVAQPGDMQETFRDPTLDPAIRLGPIVTVVDAPKFPKLRAMLGEFYTDQVAGADLIVLNKVDLASADELESVRREVVSLNSNAGVLFSERCDVDVTLVLEGDAGPAKASSAPARAPAGEPGHDHDDDHDHDDEHEHDHEGEHAHAPFQSFVVDAGRDADRAALEAFFAGLPAEVLRAKGFMTVEGQPSLVQFVGGDLEITPADRRQNQQMVFIGKDLDRAAIEAGFAFAVGGAGSAGKRP